MLKVILYISLNNKLVINPVFESCKFSRKWLLDPLNTWHMNYYTEMGREKSNWNYLGSVWRTERRGPQHMLMWVWNIFAIFPVFEDFYWQLSIVQYLLDQTNFASENIFLWKSRRKYGHFDNLTFLYIETSLPFNLFSKMKWIKPSLADWRVFESKKFPRPCQY